MAISPDGTTLVYSAGTLSPSTQLFAKRSAQLDAVPIGGTEGGTFPFFSPDGAWVAFVEGRAVRKIPSTGGESQTVISEPGASALRSNLHGGTWLADNTIVLGSLRGGLARVPASGGQPQTLTTPDAAKGESGHILPVAVGGGSAVLFTVRFGPNAQRDRIEKVDLETGARQVLTGGTAVGLVNERIVFVRNTSIWTAPFDSSTGELRGSPAEMVSGVAFSSNPVTPVVAAGAGGSLAYELADSEGYEQRTLVWVDKTGHEQPIDAPARAWWWPNVSPDGRRLGVHIMNSANMDAWMYDLDHGPLTRVTHAAESDGSPMWSPDGKRVVFCSRRLVGRRL